MAELSWDRAIATLVFASSFAFILAAYADWRWPESKWPMQGQLDVDIALAIVLSLIGGLAIVYHGWKQKQQDTLEK